MTNGGYDSVKRFVDVDGPGVVQTESSKRPADPSDPGLGLGVFVQDPATEQQSLSDDHVDVEEEWEQLDPTSAILEAMNSKESPADTVERVADYSSTALTLPPGLHSEMDAPIELEESYQGYYGFQYGHPMPGQVSDGGMFHGSWQSPGYTYYEEQWQINPATFISAFGYCDAGYDFSVPTKAGKPRGRGKHAEMSGLWITHEKMGSLSSQTYERPAQGVDASDPRRIVWTLEKASLTSKNKDREKVSPSFRVPMGSHDVEFKLNLFATSVSSNRHCSSFKKAKGKGYVALRCVQSINDCTHPTLKFRVVLGEEGSVSKQTSPFIEHDFAEKQICNIPAPLHASRGEEEWDFLNADADKLTFVVVLEVAAPST